MPADPIKRPAIPLRFFTREEKAELQRMASEREVDVNYLLSIQLSPLRKQLRRRLGTREQR